MLLYSTIWNYARLKKSTNWNWNAHYSTQKILSCNLCEALFAHESALNKHVMEEHTDPVTLTTTMTFAASLPSVSTVPNPQPNEEPIHLKFTRKICKTQLKTLKEYQNHMNHHSKLKSTLKLKQKKKKKTSPVLNQEHFEIMPRSNIMAQYTPVTSM